MDKLISDYQRYMALAEPPPDEPNTTNTTIQQQPTQVAELVTEPRNRGPRRGQSSAQHLQRAGQLIQPSAQRHQDAPLQTANLRPTRTRVMINNLEEYLQWRREGGRSVSPPTQRMLERATKAVESVREQIPMRGNVRTDIKKTNGEASRRLEVARLTVEPALRLLALYSNVPFKLKEMAISVAAAKLTGSGNCDELSQAALLEAGTQLEKDEILVGGFDASLDHLFAQLKSYRADGTERVVVLDAWANGPAVLHEDHACEQEWVYDYLPFNICNPIEAEIAIGLASALEAAYSEDLTEMENELENLKDQDGSPAEFRLYDEKSVTRLQGPLNRPQS